MKTPATDGTRPGSGRPPGADVNDLTVTCGCSRTMTPDTMRGRGAYRCGCGARIKIDQPAYRADTCMALVADRRCRQTPRTRAPFLLCKEHLNDLKAAVGLIRPEELPEYTDRLAAAQMGVVNGPDFDQEHWMARYIQRKMDAEKNLKPVVTDRKEIERLANPASLVYFICMGDLIKIGYTSDLRRRVQGLSLTMGHVLATVQGGPALEQELHERFAGLREHGEWFRADPPLLEYIAQLKPNRRVS